MSEKVDTVTGDVTTNVCLETQPLSLTPFCIWSYSERDELQHIHPPHQTAYIHL